MNMTIYPVKEHVTRITTGYLKKFWLSYCQITFLRPEYRKNKNRTIIFSPKSEFLLSYEPYRILKSKIDNIKAYGEDFNKNNAVGGQHIFQRS